jgi:Flp pilus assembly protein TadG
VTNLLHEEDGYVLIVTALCMVALMGFVGLAVDVGMLFRARTNLQKVADAAAIAGASELRSGNYVAASVYSASQNGTSCATPGCVTATLGSTYHPNASVKVTVSSTAPSYFTKVFGYSGFPISATAVAGLSLSESACLYAIDTTPKKNGLVIDGGGGGTGLTLSQCGAYVNGNLDLNGNNATITAQWIGAVSTSGSGNPTPAVVTPIVPVNDPLSGYWTAPSCGSPLNDPNLRTGQASPGCYRSLTLSGTATLAPGLYIVEGGLNLNVTGATGVSFYVDGANGGTVNTFSGNFTAPPIGTGTSGTCTSGNGCNGLLLWDTETATSSHPVIFGSSTFTGIMYLPNAAVKFNGSTTTTLNSTIVAASYTMDGSVTINNYGGSSSPLAAATLLE